MDITMSPIGVIRTPFADVEGMPIQPRGAAGIAGRIEMNAGLVGGLADLEGFSHLILLYVFHKSKGYDLSVKPFLDNSNRGLFATRAPRRPNPVGISVVKLVGIDTGVIHIAGADVLDGTPLLDIKPYVPVFDSFPEARAGWLEAVAHRADSVTSDDRFRS